MKLFAALRKEVGKWAVRIEDGCAVTHGTSGIHVFSFAAIGWVGCPQRAFVASPNSNVLAAEDIVSHH